MRKNTEPFLLHDRGESNVESSDLRSVEIVFSYHDYREVKALQTHVARAESVDGVGACYTMRRQATGVFWRDQERSQFLSLFKSINLDEASGPWSRWGHIVKEVRNFDPTQHSCGSDYEDYLLDTSDFIEVDATTVVWVGSAVGERFQTQRVPIAFLDVLFAGYPRWETVTQSLDDIIRQYCVDIAEIDQAITGAINQLIEKGVLKGKPK